MEENDVSSRSNIKGREDSEDLPSFMSEEEAQQLNVSGTLEGRAGSNAADTKAYKDLASYVEETRGRSTHMKPIGSSVKSDEAQARLSLPKVDFRQRLGTWAEGMGKVRRISLAVGAFFLLLMVIVGIISTIGFTKRLIGKMDDPIEVGHTLVQTLEKGDFAAYRQLLSSDHSPANNESLFNALKSGLDTANENLISNYILVRLENGKQYLCSIYFDKGKKEYRIRQAAEVPAEMHKIFVS